MHYVKFLIIFLAAATLFLTAGCGEQQQSVQEEKPQTTAEDVQQQAKELVDATKSYTMEQREAYEQQLTVKLDDYRQRIADLNQQMSVVKEEMKMEMQDKIDQLQARVEDMKGKAAELKDATGDAWVDLKDGLDRAGEELEKTMADIRQDFQKSSSSY